MTDDGFDRITQAWLDAKPSRISDRALQSALDEVHVTRQRRSWWPARRIPSMTNPLRLMVAVGAIVLAVAVGTSMLSGNGGVGGPAPTVTPAPSPKASPIPLELNSLNDSPPLIAGARYVTRDPFPFRVSITAPEGWIGKVGGPYAVWFGPANGGDIVSFQRFENLYADPCHPERGQLDPALGPSVSDLVDALSHLPGVTASSPTNVAISGYSGRQLTLTAPAAAVGCTNATFLLWTLPGGVGNVMSPGTREQLTILDVGGERVVLLAISPVGQSATDQADIKAVLDSVQVEPTN